MGERHEITRRVGVHIEVRDLRVLEEDLEDKEGGEEVALRDVVC